MQFFCCREEHIRGFISVEAAVRDVEGAVGLRYVVRVAISEQPGDAVNGRRAAFKFEKCADGGLIDLHFQVAGTVFWRAPSRRRPNAGAMATAPRARARRNGVGGPDFFIAERWTQPQRA